MLVKNPDPPAVAIASDPIVAPTVLAIPPSGFDALRAIFQMKLIPLTGTWVRQ
jgi:hypothetical protein